MYSHISLTFDFLFSLTFFIFSFFFFSFFFFSFFFFYSFSFSFIFFYFLYYNYREIFTVLRDNFLFENWTRLKLEKLTNLCDKKVFELGDYIFKQVCGVCVWCGVGWGVCVGCRVFVGHVCGICMGYVRFGMCVEYDCIYTIISH